MEVKYVRGDATCPQHTDDKPVVLMHICNNKGGLGAGFVVALSKKWKLPEQKYRQWSAETNHNPPLGQTQFVGVGGDIHVANMVAQDGFGGVAVKYDKLRECIKQVCEYAKSINASVHAPRIGTGLGGGSWDKIEPIIQQELCDQGVEVTIYDFDR